MGEQEIAGIFSEMLGRDVSSITRLGPGRNSQVYRLDCPDGACLAGKRYFSDPADPRDRMGSEVSSLRFMHNHGVTCVPGVIAADWDRHCAVYEYVDGRELAGQEVSPAHVDELVHFLAQLHQLGKVPEATELPEASDACHSLADILQGIRKRLAHLRAVPNDSRVNLDLHSFLAEEFSPVFERVAQFSIAQAQTMGMDAQTLIPREQCVLSPSDVGFHNALELPDGKMIFLDFEYFGWDDPAKMLSDFLLHPAVEIGHKLKQHFLDGILGTPGVDGQLVRRLVATFPLHGLKWCMILLNEFVPASLARREFSGQEASDRHTICARQLDKARAMLRKIEREYECFPYIC